MKDVAGKEIRLGNHVKIGTADRGVVVFSIDTHEYSSDFQQKDWEYLQKGIMVRTNGDALIHFTGDSDSEDLEIIAE